MVAESRSRRRYSISTLKACSYLVGVIGTAHILHVNNPYTLISHITVRRYASELPAAREELPSLIAVSKTTTARALVFRFFLHPWTEKT